MYKLSIIVQSVGKYVRVAIAIAIAITFICLYIVVCVSFVCVCCEKQKRIKAIWNGWKSRAENLDTKHRRHLLVLKTFIVFYSLVAGSSMYNCDVSMHSVAKCMRKCMHVCKNAHHF